MWVKHFVGETSYSKENELEGWRWKEYSDISELLNTKTYCSPPKLPKKSIVSEFIDERSC